MSLFKEMHGDVGDHSMLESVSDHSFVANPSVEMILAAEVPTLGLNAGTLPVCGETGTW